MWSLRSTHVAALAACTTNSLRVPSLRPAAAAAAAVLLPSSPLVQRRHRVGSAYSRRRNRDDFPFPAAPEFDPSAAPPRPARPLALDQVLRKWQHERNILSKAAEVGLRDRAATMVLNQFTKSLKGSGMGAAKTPPGQLPAMYTKLDEAWVTFLQNYVPEGQRAMFNHLCETSDLRNPPECPLRLLAHEVYETLTSQSIPCTMVTGEERRGDPHAGITSCTIEMADLTREYDVAVIDEIQMLGDAHRGWAWTQALLGLRAKRIYLCGEATAVPVVEKLCRATNDRVVVNEFKRLSPLQVAESSLKGGVGDVQKGDCVVAFSRKNLYTLKNLIEEVAGLKCAVVYGALPPETRSMQARLFNDPKADYDVLVATDAVGMGLNLSRAAPGRFGRGPGVGKLPNETLAGLLGKFEALARVNGEVYSLCNLEAQKNLAGAIQDIPMSIRDRFQFVLSPVNDRSPDAVRVLHALASHYARDQPLRLLSLLALPHLALNKALTQSAIAAIRTFDPDSSDPDALLSVLAEDALFADAHTSDTLAILEDTHRAIMTYLWLRQRYGGHATFAAATDAECTWVLTQCNRAIEDALNVLSSTVAAKRGVAGGKRAKRKSAALFDEEVETIVPDELKTVLRDVTKSAERAPRNKRGEADWEVARRSGWRWRRIRTGLSGGREQSRSAGTT
ncbi:hypothetical protein AMAG_17417 [Allomyces macrogynus ATCC 38327]|uniref:Uncharacterized protein n=1 Tax=Allomyces macrogynus (strain ATCC 38327) TaxID=578462 RepID=A0A0L0TEE3_ALLM3|nr:hypothetical protein AMAG_17417 [Allomyces macrogynus ATCC 38327]|eukprot:KNE73233.1 hypothetical protein AMAG_17417 [Allomyces macrogynus ATCC 38327]